MHVLNFGDNDKRLSLSPIFFTEHTPTRTPAKAAPLEAVAQESTVFERRGESWRSQYASAMGERRRLLELEQKTFVRIELYRF